MASIIHKFTDYILDEYDQEMPQSHTQTYPNHHEEEANNDISHMISRET